MSGEFGRLYERLEESLNKIDDRFTGATRYVRTISLIREVILDMKTIARTAIDSRETEISFFREVWPTLYGKLFQYIMIHCYEMDKLSLPADMRQGIIRREERRVAHFFRDHAEFCLYYRGGSPAINELFTLQYSMARIFDELSLVIDPEGGTIASYRAAWCLAYEAYKGYLEKEMDRLLHPETAGKGRRYTWRPGKTAAVELIQSLVESESIEIDGQKATAALFKADWEEKYSDSLKDYDVLLYQSDSRKGRMISLETTVKYMWSRSERNKGVILLTAKDISFRIAEENRLLRAIIESQEKDRIRMSRDYHDNIIQQIAGMHFFFCSIAPVEVDPKIKERYDEYIRHLDKIISDIRGICFDLMPVTLQDSGLVDAVYELCYETLKPRNIKYIMSSSDCFPAVDAGMRIDLYRVIQEFLNNAIRNGKARRISMKFTTVENLISIDLRDNGLGFDTFGRVKNGMGIQNMLSRVKSHNGKLTMHSVPSKGTHFNIKVPIKVTQ